MNNVWWPDYNWPFKRLQRPSDAAVELRQNQRDFFPVEIAHYLGWMGKIWKTYSGNLSEAPAKWQDGHLVEC